MFPDTPGKMELVSDVLSIMSWSQTHTELRYTQPHSLLLFNPTPLFEDAPVQLYFSTCQWYMSVPGWVRARARACLGDGRRKPPRPNNNVLKLLNMAWNDFIAFLH